MSSAIADPRAMLDAAPMSRAQIGALAIVSALSALDGYDTLAVSFAAPGITRSWGLGMGALGLVLSSGLLGMALGSFLLAPFADVIGRRRIVIVNLILMGGGMLLSAFATSIVWLAAWRVVTGIGIGSMVPIITPLAVEFSNGRRRAPAVAMMVIGYPLGATLGGFAAAVLLHNFAWPSVFLFGAGVALLLLPIVILWLPEPLAFLMERRDGRSLDRVNALLNRCNLGSVDSLPAPVARKNVAYREIFRPGRIGATLTMTLINLLYVMSVYYILSWLPQIIAQAGYSASVATAVSATANLCGAAMVILCAFAAARIRVHVLGSAMMIGLGLATASFGLVQPTLLLLGLMGVLIGTFVHAGVFGLYATIVDKFDPAIRATGTGFVMGVGRGGAAFAPAIAGGLFSLGAGTGFVSVAFGALALIAGLLLLWQGRLGRPI
ncbi:MAG TPA: MFS transporter [Allosphingosinicella sp.]|jgi:benzoate transport